MKSPTYDKRQKAAIEILCEEFKKHNHIPPEAFQKYDVKRGLRNADGTGVLAGLTLISNVHGYVINEGEREPIDGQLFYRGYAIQDIVREATDTKRYGFEEVIYLLLFGVLPNQQEAAYFKDVLGMLRELPEGFTEDIILKLPSQNIMNKLQSAVLALYTYDPNPDSTSIEEELRKAIGIIAKLPILMTAAYHSKQKSMGKSLVLHPVRDQESVAQSILSTLRYDRNYTEEEAHLLDVLLLLHAEHGGGNNSTFSCRTLTSSGTDAYSAYAAAIGSLKGPKHGGANIKVMQMLQSIKNDVKNWNDPEEIKSCLRKLLRREAGDRSGLIYGMGHAVYTQSDPRAVLLKTYAMKLAKGTPFEPQFELLQWIEQLTPAVLKEVKGSDKVVCANVDLYSGLVYQMLGVPEDLYTPLFAVSRIAGWAAHRMEELLTGGRIIRPAYKSIRKAAKFIPMKDR